MGFGALIFFLGAVRLFAPTKEIFLKIGELGKSALRLGPLTSKNVLPTGGVTYFSAPSISPAYVGVGYIIGPTLAALNFSGGVLAWGLLIPLLIYFLGPQIQTFLPPGADAEAWGGQATAVWRYMSSKTVFSLIGVTFILMNKEHLRFVG